MLGTLFGLVTGGYGPLVAAGLLAAVSFGGGVYVTHHWDASTLAELKAANDAQAAKDNAIALAQVRAHDAAANKAMSELAKLRAQRATNNNTLREAIAHAPKTKACVSSPAIRALLDGLRQHGSAGGH